MALSAHPSPRALAPIKILRFPCCHFSFASRPLCWERDSAERRRSPPGPSPRSWRATPERGIKFQSHPETRSSALKVCARTKRRWQVDCPRNRIAPPPPFLPRVLRATSQLPRAVPVSHDVKISSCKKAKKKTPTNKTHSKPKTGGKSVLKAFKIIFEVLFKEQEMGCLEKMIRKWH